jgi:hypothetical protein
MIWGIIGIIVIGVFAQRMLGNDNRCDIAWSEGKKGEAVLWYLWMCAKSFIFFFCLPFLIMFFFFRD